MTIIILLGIIGIALVFLEFFLPGAVLAVIGTLLMLVSLGLCFAKFSPLVGVFYLLGLLLSVIFTCKLALWQLKRSQKKSDFYHGQDQEGYIASSFDPSLEGKTGIVSTELKPAGHVTIEGRLYQALSETGFISKGESVLVVGGKGSHLIVRGKLPN